MCLLIFSVFVPMLVAAVRESQDLAALTAPLLGFAVLVGADRIFKGKDGALIRALALAFYITFWLLGLQAALS